MLVERRIERLLEEMVNSELRGEIRTRRLSGLSCVVEVCLSHANGNVVAGLGGYVTATRSVREICDRRGQGRSDQPLVDCAELTNGEVSEVDRTEHSIWTYIYEKMA